MTLINITTRLLWIACLGLCTTSAGCSASLNSEALLIDHSGTASTQGLIVSGRIMFSVWAPRQLQNELAFVEFAVSRADGGHRGPGESALWSNVRLWIAPVEPSAAGGFQSVNGAPPHVLSCEAGQPSWDPSGPIRGICKARDLFLRFHAMYQVQAYSLDKAFASEFYHVASPSDFTIHVPKHNRPGLEGSLPAWLFNNNRTIDWQPYREDGVRAIAGFWESARHRGKQAAIIDWNLCVDRSQDGLTSGTGQHEDEPRVELIQDKRSGDQPYYPEHLYPNTHYLVSVIRSRRSRGNGPNVTLLSSPLPFMHCPQVGAYGNNNQIYQNRSSAGAPYPYQNGEIDVSVQKIIDYDNE